MNSREAKKILQAWRPGHVEERDPQVAEALHLARRDPGLQDWLKKHAAFQETMRDGFRAIPVPGDLRSKIAALRRSRPGRGWRHPAALAAAAAVLLLGLAAFWFRPSPESSFATFRSRMVSTVLREYTMDLATNNQACIRQFLDSNSAPSDYVLPPGLASLPALGAGLLSWQGERVSMVCIDSAGEGTLFLFVVDRAAVRQSPPGTPQFIQVNKLMTASWTQGNRSYLLAGQGGRDSLGKYF